MGNSDDIIDWNFDNDDLNKPIWNIASENMKIIEFPIFEYNYDSGEENIEDDDEEGQVDQLSDQGLNISVLSDGIVQ